MSRFTINDLFLPGLKVVTRKRVEDNRGCLSRIFCTDELATAGWSGAISQINHTFTTKRGTVRGLHFQHSPYGEIKLVTCLSGEVWDVAVDIRNGSPTFLQWHAERLSADNATALLIPEGFAHGYQAMCDGVELLYCHSSAYFPDAAGGLNPIDPSLEISWPLEITELSCRDSHFSMLDDTFLGIAL